MKIDCSYTVACDYKELNGEKKKCLFIHLYSYFDIKTGWKVVKGYDLLSNEVCDFIVARMSNIANIRHVENHLEVVTNWYTVSENGVIKFNHQDLNRAFGDKPQIINNQYGLQSRWENMNWLREYVYTYQGEVLYKRKINQAFWRDNLEGRDNK